MSTVSGGGYLGSSISTLMRSKTKPVSEVDGKIIEVSAPEHGERVVRLRGRLAGACPNSEEVEREYRYANFARLDARVAEGAEVKAGQRLLRRVGAPEGTRSVSLWDRFRWRVRPSALLREMVSKLNETHNWINLSDGGHIENLAGIELLRRRCRIVIIGDGEADPNLHFNGLATLIRFARLDLGIEIEIDTQKIHLKSHHPDDKYRESEEHFAVGRIRYPKTATTGAERGYLLYLKSSFTGDEDEVIREYRHRNPSFPHESTADQFFDEGQFEAYRALGQHIAEGALKELGARPGGEFAYSELEAGLESLCPKSDAGGAPGREPKQGNSD